jgi:hypothetical protein
MRLDTRAFAFAAGAGAATLYTLCTLAVAIDPGATTAFFSSFLVGLAWWTVWAGAAFGLASAIYNRLTRQPRFVASPSRQAVA